jgi:hypothetical protein
VEKHQVICVLVDYLRHIVNWASDQRSDGISLQLGGSM